jgi:putative transposase
MRVSNARKDFLHKTSTKIAKNHGVVVLEKLEARNMVRSAAGTMEAPGKNVRAKSGLNRAILDQGWGMFDRFLEYKLPEYGGRTAHVPAPNSSRECSACGRVDERNRNGARFLCVGCGHTEHADTNASKVVKRRWDTPLLPVGASGCRAVEAGTRQRAVA